MSTLDSLHAQLDERPDDWDGRRILADLYLDGGDDLRAAYYRLAAQEGLAPGRYFAITAPVGWAWKPEQMPLEVYLGLDNPGLLIGSKGFATRREAEDNLARKLRELGYI